MKGGEYDRASRNFHYSAKYQGDEIEYTALRRNHALRRCDCQQFSIESDATSY